MAISLEKGLLGEVLGIVVIPDPVVGVRVDVAQMVPIELLEAAVGFGLALLRIVPARGRGTPEEQLPTEVREGAAYIRVTPAKYISWDYGRPA